MRYLSLVEHLLLIAIFINLSNSEEATQFNFRSENCESEKAGCCSKIEIKAYLTSCDPAKACTLEGGNRKFSSNIPFPEFERDGEVTLNNVVKCRWKLVITMKFTNAGKTRLGEDLITLDSAYNCFTQEKTRLLHPLVFKIKQEQVLQMYDMKFLHVVNAEATEEVINKCNANFTGCDDFSDTPTCGFAYYKGQKIPYSQGFCCSCNAAKNAERQPPCLNEASGVYSEGQLNADDEERQVLSTSGTERSSSDSTSDSTSAVATPCTSSTCSSTATCTTTTCDDKASTTENVSPLSQVTGREETETQKSTQNAYKESMLQGSEPSVQRPEYARMFHKTQIPDANSKYKTHTDSDSRLSRTKSSKHKGGSVTVYDEEDVGQEEDGESVSSERDSSPLSNAHLRTKSTMHPNGIRLENKILNLRGKLKTLFSSSKDELAPDFQRTTKKGRMYKDQNVESFERTRRYGFEGTEELEERMAPEASFIEEGIADATDIHAQLKHRGKRLTGHRKSRPKTRDDLEAATSQQDSEPELVSARAAELGISPSLYEQMVAAVEAELLHRRPHFRQKRDISQIEEYKDPLEHIREFRRKKRTLRLRLLDAIDDVFRRHKVGESQPIGGGPSERERRAATLALAREVVDGLVQEDSETGLGEMQEMVKQCHGPIARELGFSFEEALPTPRNIRVAEEASCSTQAENGAVEKPEEATLLDVVAQSLEGSEIQSIRPFRVDPVGNPQNVPYGSEFTGWFHVPSFVSKNSSKGFKKGPMRVHKCPCPCPYCKRCSDECDSSSIKTNLSAFDEPGASSSKSSMFSDLENDRISNSDNKTKMDDNLIVISFSCNPSSTDFSSEENATSCSTTGNLTYNSSRISDRDNGYLAPDESDKVGRKETKIKGALAKKTSCSTTKGTTTCSTTKRPTTCSTTKGTTTCSTTKGTTTCSTTKGTTTCSTTKGTTTCSTTKGTTTCSTTKGTTTCSTTKGTTTCSTTKGTTTCSTTKGTTTCSTTKKTKGTTSKKCTTTKVVATKNRKLKFKSKEQNIKTEFDPDTDNRASNVDECMKYTKSGKCNYIELRTTLQPSNTGLPPSASVSGVLLLWTNNPDNMSNMKSTSRYESDNTLSTEFEEADTNVPGKALKQEKATSRDEANALTPSPGGDVPPGGEEVDENSPEKLRKAEKASPSQDVTNERNPTPGSTLSSECEESDRDSPRKSPQRGTFLKTSLDQSLPLDCSSGHGQQDKTENKFFPRNKVSYQEMFSRIEGSRSSTKNPTENSYRKQEWSGTLQEMPDVGATQTTSSENNLLESQDSYEQRITSEDETDISPREDMVSQDITIKSVLTTKPESGLKATTEDKLYVLLMQVSSAMPTAYKSVQLGYEREQSPSEVSNNIKIVSSIVETTESNESARDSETNSHTDKIFSDHEEHGDIILSERDGLRKESAEDSYSDKSWRPIHNQDDQEIQNIQVWNNVRSTPAIDKSDRDPVTVVPVKQRERFTQALTDESASDNEEIDKSLSSKHNQNDRERNNIKTWNKLGHAYSIGKTDRDSDYGDVITESNTVIKLIPVKQKEEFSADPKEENISGNEERENANTLLERNMRVSKDILFSSPNNPSTNKLQIVQNIFVATTPDGNIEPINFKEINSDQNKDNTHSKIYNSFSEINPVKRIHLSDKYDRKIDDSPSKGAFTVGHFQDDMNEGYIILRPRGSSESHLVSNERLDKSHTTENAERNTLPPLTIAELVEAISLSSQAGSLDELNDASDTSEVNILESDDPTESPLQIHERGKSGRMNPHISLRVRKNNFRESSPVFEGAKQTLFVRDGAGTGDENGAVVNEYPHFEMSNLEHHNNEFHAIARGPPADEVTFIDPGTALNDDVPANIREAPDRNHVRRQRTLLSVEGRMRASAVGDRRPEDDALERREISGIAPPGVHQEVLEGESGMLGSHIKSSEIFFSSTNVTNAMNSHRFVGTHSTEDSFKDADRKYDELPAADTKGSVAHSDGSAPDVYDDGSEGVETLAASRAEEMAFAGGRAQDATEKPLVRRKRSHGAARSHKNVRRATTKPPAAHLHYRRERPRHLGAVGAAILDSKLRGARRRDRHRRARRHCRRDRRRRHRREGEGEGGEEAGSARPRPRPRRRRHRHRHRRRRPRGCGIRRSRLSRQVGPDGRQVRGGQDCQDDSAPPNVDARRYHESAHCLRFSDHWYSAYGVAEPAVAHAVSVEVFERRADAAGCRWVDVTRGEAVRLDVFNRRVRDEAGAFAFTYSAPRVAPRGLALQADDVRLLVPQPPDAPGAAFPQADGGAAEFLVVPASGVSADGRECDRAGVGFAAFATQPDRCARPRGSCLRAQPLDLWRRDAELKKRGRPGKYFLQSFARLPPQPLRPRPGSDDTLLALAFDGALQDVVDLELSADFNAPVSSGLHVLLEWAVSDGTAGEHAALEASVANLGLSAAALAVRVAGCAGAGAGAGGTARWERTESAPVSVPPQHSRALHLRLPGAAPLQPVDCTVEVVGAGAGGTPPSTERASGGGGGGGASRVAAARRVTFGGGRRCACAWQCACACVGTCAAGAGALPGAACHALPVAAYRAAGAHGDLPLDHLAERPPAAEAAAWITSLWMQFVLFGATVLFLLMALGLLKGLVGCCCCPSVSRWGLGMFLDETRRLPRYYEKELAHRRVVYDEEGYAVHPDTALRTIRYHSRATELCVNTLFFLLFPIAILMALCRRCCARGADADAEGNRYTRWSERGRGSGRGSGSGAAGSAQARPQRPATLGDVRTSMRAAVRDAAGGDRRRSSRKPTADLEEEGEGAESPELLPYEESDEEERDTRYVMEQLRRSRDTLRKSSSKRRTTEEDIPLMQGPRVSVALCAPPPALWGEGPALSALAQSAQQRGVELAVRLLRARRAVFRNLQMAVGGVLSAPGLPYCVRGSFALDQCYKRYVFTVRMPAKQYWRVVEGGVERLEPPRPLRGHELQVSFRSAREVLRANELSISPLGPCINSKNPKYPAWSKEERKLAEKELEVLRKSYNWIFPDTDYSGRGSRGAGFISFVKERLSAPRRSSVRTLRGSASLEIEELRSSLRESERKMRSEEELRELEDVPGETELRTTLTSEDFESHEEEPRLKKKSTKLLPEEEGEIDEDVISMIERDKRVSQRSLKGPVKPPPRKSSEKPLPTRKPSEPTDKRSLSKAEKKRPSKEGRSQKPKRPSKEARPSQEPVDVAGLRKSIPAKVSKVEEPKPKRKSVAEPESEKRISERSIRKSSEITPLSSKGIEPTEDSVPRESIKSIPRTSRPSVKKESEPEKEVIDEEKSDRQSSLRSYKRSIPSDDKPDAEEPEKRIWIKKKSEEPESLLSDTEDERSTDLLGRDAQESRRSSLKKSIRFDEKTKTRWIEGKMPIDVQPRKSVDSETPPETEKRSSVSLRRTLDKDYTVLEEEGEIEEPVTGRESMSRRESVTGRESVKERESVKSRESMKGRESMNNEESIKDEESVKDEMVEDEESVGEKESVDELEEGDEVKQDEVMEDEERTEDEEVEDEEKVQQDEMMQDENVEDEEVGEEEQVEPEEIMEYEEKVEDEDVEEEEKVDLQGEEEEEEEEERPEEVKKVKKEEELEDEEEMEEKPPAQKPKKKSSVKKPEPQESEEEEEEEEDEEEEEEAGEDNKRKWYRKAFAQWVTEMKEWDEEGKAPNRDSMFRKGFKM